MNKMIATFFGVGLLKPAPGTWGSLAALPLFWLIFNLFGLYGIIASTVAIFYFGWKATEAFSKSSGTHDASEIVIDEVLGQFIALLPIAIGAWMTGASITALWPGWVSAFALFRLFDIWKPGVIRSIDQRSTAMSVMMDDLFAGLFAALGTCLLAGVFHAI
jgi:phosphatidylglycerophosphatase A